MLFGVITGLWAAHFFLLGIYFPVRNPSAKGSGRTLCTAGTEMSELSCMELKRTRAKSRLKPSTVLSLPVCSDEVVATLSVVVVVMPVVLRGAAVVVAAAVAVVEPSVTVVGALVVVVGAVVVVVGSEVVVAGIGVVVSGMKNNSTSCPSLCSSCEPPSPPHTPV